MPTERPAQPRGGDTATGLTPPQHAPESAPTPAPIPRQSGPAIAAGPAPQATPVEGWLFDTRDLRPRTPHAADLPACIPPTRYQGSKRKLCPWIMSCLADLEFESVLDAFSGTASVGYMFKLLGRRVTCNDILAGNYQTARALIENDAATLAADRVAELVRPAPGVGYPRFIAETFADIYFTAEENAWLDVAATNIAALVDEYSRAIAWYALCQAAIAKRPYNLFHRRNLYMRFADVPRTFGNKATWDKPFAEHFAAFVAGANAAVCNSGGRCRAMCGDALAVPGRYDLVYIDPPYITVRGVGVDYADFYHFLEGLLDYTNWPQRIDWQSRHRRMRTERTEWTDPARIHAAFARLLERFADSILVISYRSDGVPSIDELVALLSRHKSRVDVHCHGRYQYALSTNRRSAEVLLVGR